MALIKSYYRSNDTIGSRVNLIENAKNVTYEEGYFIFSNAMDTGAPDNIDIYYQHVKENEPCRIVDFDNEHGRRCRIFTALAYICNDAGKTTDKLSAEHLQKPFSESFAITTD